MKKVILQTRFVHSSFDEETKIYESEYLPETRDMTDKEWQEQMMELKELIESCRPHYIIDDNRNRLYSYSPDMQLWTLRLFVDSWNKIGLKKYAQLIPKEIIGKLTSEQIEEFAMTNFEMHYQHKFVDDYKIAYDWVIGSN
ncbi:MAG: hypothetical protein U5K79_21720 [Cyclobacteriaceae bacterium]|nr:hypothetical protein [Cyclobacteriaceae bacterium]